MKHLFKVIFILMILTGCNPYSLVDKPSGDLQILSTARACFDQGDYECASKYYQQVSPHYSDQANSETALMILAQNGLTAGVFVSAIIDGSKNGGTLITKLADALTYTANSTTRLAFFHAFLKVNLISEIHNRGLIRFITATGLMAEILAEDAGSPGKFTQADLVANPTICLSTTDPTQQLTACKAPLGKKLTLGSSIPDLQKATDADIIGPSGNPTLYMINAAITQIIDSIDELQTTGSLGSSSLNFANNTLAITLNTNWNSFTTLQQDAVYRAGLLGLGIGEN